MGLEISNRLSTFVNNDLGKVNCSQLPRCRHRFGNAYIGLNQLDDALEEHFQALDIGQSLVGDGYRTAASMHKVAWILIKRERFKDAE